MPEVLYKMPEVPDEELKVPDNESKVPDKESKMPDKESKMPDKVSNAPNIVAKAPNKASKAPNLVAKTPNKASKAPNKVAKALNKASKAPNKVSEAPDKMEKEEPPHLTPYQGKRRTCGMFNCKKCKTHWFSANSWANSFQKCKGCNGAIYPYKQFPPYPGSGVKNDTPPHPQHLCQKCMQLGYFCGAQDYGREE